MSESNNAATGGVATALRGADPLTSAEVEELEETCKQIRALILQEIGSIGVGHIGGSLSMVEALVTLYSRHLRFDPRNPQWEERDRFVLSKGHSGPGYYATLAHFGFFDPAELLTLNKPGTRLPSHPDMNRTPGVDMTSGSLGQGFSCSVGIANGQRSRGWDSRTYTLIGDGESQEGQIWEAALWGAQLGLDNLIAMTDYNDMCIDGYVHEVNDVAPLDEKWQAFRWYTQVVDGHDVAAIDDALTRAERHEGGPSMIILRTVKGKGISSIEAAGVGNHSMPVTQDMVEKGLAELKEGKIDE